MRRILEEPPERDLALVGIDVDGRRRSISERRFDELEDQLGRPFPIVAADDRVLVLYGKVMGLEAIPGTPTFFFIDREGMVYSWHAGTIDPAEIMAPVEFLYGVDRYRPDRWGDDGPDATESPK